MFSGTLISKSTEKEDTFYGYFFIFFFLFSFSFFLNYILRSRRAKILFENFIAPDRAVFVLDENSTFIFCSATGSFLPNTVILVVGLGQNLHNNNNNNNDFRNRDA